MFAFLDGQIAAFTTGLFFAAGFSILMAVLVQRRRETAGIRYFTLQWILQAVWALSVALEILAPDLSTKVFIHKISRIGLWGVSVAWLYFVFFYTNQGQRLTRRISMLILGVFALLLGFVITNELHLLFWSSVKLATGELSGAVYARGPVDWVSLGFTQALVLAAWVELIWIGLRSSMVYRQQAFLWMFVGAIPGVFSLLYILGLTERFDYSPYAFFLTSILAFLAIYRFRFYSLVPLARGKLLQNLPDGILAIDAQGRLLDVNEAFLSVAGIKKWHKGQPVEQLLSGSKEILDGLRENLDHSRTLLIEQANGRFYEMSVSCLEVRPGRLDGRLAILRNVTGAHQAAQAQRRSEENIRRLFEANPFPMAIMSMEQEAIIEVNQAGLDYFQISREGIIGRLAASFFVDPEMGDEIDSEFHQSGQIRGKPIEIKKPNGKHGYVVLNIFPVDYYGEPSWLVTFADITDRKQFEDAEHEQRELAVVALETSTLLTSTLNFEEVLDRILENVSRIVPAESTTVILVDDQGIGKVARARGFLEHGHETPLGKTFLNIHHTDNLRWMVEHRSAMSIIDVSKDAQWIAFPGMEWERAYLGVPMFTQEGIAGFLCMNDSTPGFFSSSDAARLQIYAAQAGIAIQNAQLYLRIQNTAHENEVLQEIASAVSSSLDFDLVIERIFELILRLVPSDSVGVQMIEGDEFVLRAFRDMGKEVAMVGERWKLAGTANQRALIERRPINFPDVQAEFADYRKAPINKIRSVLMIPLISGGEVIGFLSLDSWYLNHFTHENERLAGVFSTNIAVALENSLLYEETQRRLKVQSILNQISHAASSKLDLDEILELVWEQVNRFLDAGYFYVAAKTNTPDVWMCRYNRQAGLLQKQPEPLSARGVIKYVIQNKLPIFLRGRSEIEVFERVTGVQLQFETARSLMVVPLQVSGIVTGAMEIFNIEHDLAYSQDDFDLFSSIAAQVAVSLENSRLYEETRRRAEEMEILNRVGLSITAGLDRERVLLNLLEQCRLTMPVDCFYVALYHRETDMIEFPLFYDQESFLEIQPLLLSENSGMTHQVLREPRTYYLPELWDPQTIASYNPINVGGVASRSYVGVPLVLREQTIGIISVQSTQQNAYTPEQIHLLEMISIQTAIAIENARLYSEAQLMATTDFLTGMLNRRELFVRADQEFERARRYRHDLAVMMIDIDHFKPVNDTYGHLAGDRVLSSLARICQKSMRHMDVLGRYGGEEILILMPETDQMNAVAAAERLRMEISDMAVETDGGEVQVTVSVGVTSYHNERGINLEMLISRADNALFAAKAAGRNCVCVYQDTSQQA